MGIVLNELGLVNFNNAGLSGVVGFWAYPLKKGWYIFSLACI